MSNSDKPSNSDPLYHETIWRYWSILTPVVAAVDWSPPPIKPKESWRHSTTIFYFEKIEKNIVTHDDYAVYRTPFK